MCCFLLIQPADLYAYQTKPIGMHRGTRKKSNPLDLTIPRKASDEAKLEIKICVSKRIDAIKVGYFCENTSHIQNVAKGKKKEIYKKGRSFALVKAHTRNRSDRSICGGEAPNTLRYLAYSSIDTYHHYQHYQHYQYSNTKAEGLRSETADSRNKVAVKIRDRNL
ncbi:uncharacterized protein Bfra_009643 [Botrytis fragariae]|uniref:Uncharacterized protein n=1 Tax=Botrytis fragariae TaxID=1964551 RepID=A0A8H6AN13_9HELO|nr:uncharacterized protein Bfra_009643 [Botrytis fragariae]KAF5870260.1 hypothetical protein Bfra_009643 [Botrytis fragariae]